MGKRALSLIEILVSIIVLALVVTGLTQVFLSARKFSIHSRSRATAMQLGKFMLDYLPVYTNATATGWNATTSAINITAPSRYCGGALEQITGCPPEANRTIDNTVYTAQYNITDTGNVRKVTLNIFWNETTNK